MSRTASHEELICRHRQEKKDLLALTQKMKSSVPKGDKKKKKDVMAEISLMVANLDIKHEEEKQKFKAEQLAVMNEQNEAAINEQSEAAMNEQSEAAMNEQNEAVMNEQKEDNVEMSGDQVPNKDFTETDVSEMEVSDHVCEGPNAMQKLSKAQKRRNKKAEKEKAREMAISEQELENVKGTRFLEAEEITEKLSLRRLILQEIPSDGNCLFKAIEHQLSVHNLKRASASELRALTSNYLINHKEDFQPFLINPETDDMYSDDQYMAYCENIKDPSVWGGHVEIQALAHICGKPIEIVQANGPNIISGEDTGGPKLTISYHRHEFGLGAHYNSTRPV